MKFIDTHCHLNIDPFLEDPQGVVERALAQGVEHMLVIGIDLATSETAIRLADTFPQIYAAAGIHPTDVSKAPAHWEKEILDMLSHPRVVAVGETGLDYYWDDSQKELQQRFFRDHLDLALASGKPAVIHNRDADADIVNLVLEHGNTRGVFHCWPSPWDVAQPLLQKGYHISFTGTVTFRKNDAVQNVAAQMPLDRLLLETDSPFLTPAPHRGKRPNEPQYIPHIAAKIAELRQLTVKDIALATTQNADRLFFLGLRQQVDSQHD